MTPNDPLDVALAHARAGREPEARAVLDTLLARHPDHAEALHMVGVLALQSGNYAEAAQYLEAAAERAPRVPMSWANLGVARAVMGHFSAALQAHDKALRLDPGNPELLRNKAVTLRRLGRAEESLACARQAAARLKDDVIAIRAVGEALLDLGRTVESLGPFNEAIALAPNDAVSIHNRGTARYALGDIGGAIDDYRRAIGVAPDLARSHDHLALALLDLGQAEEALPHAERAVHLQPTEPVYLANLAFALDQLGRGAEALERCEAALAIDARCALAWMQRAVSLASAGRDTEADVAHARAIVIGAEDVGTLIHRLHLRRKSCDWRGHAWLASRIASRAEAGASCPPFALLHVPATAALQRAAAERHAAAAMPAPQAAPALARRERLRVAFFSADFHDHPVTERVLPVLERMDRDRFELSAFSFSRTPDDGSTQRVQAACDPFVDVRAAGDREVVAIARNLGIDLAIDLMGHTAGARPGLFARRVAPRQAHWLGFPGTMGTAAMDFIIADGTVIPEADRGHYSERVIALPGSYQPNARPRTYAQPDRGALGLPADAFVFAAFNDRLKLTPEVFSAWLRILAAVPKGVLWIADAGTRAGANLLAAAGDAGVEASRIIFAKRVALKEHRARLSAADLALDTLPYGGHATTSDLLAAGVPVVTVLGNTFAGRVPASVLRAADLPELVTASLADYERLAISLAQDRATLAALRRKAEAARSGSALFDIDRFTRAFEAACEEMLK